MAFNWLSKDNFKYLLDKIKGYIDTYLSGKSNTDHTHDSRYYTETEIDSKISTINSNLAQKQNADTAITTSNIGSQSVKYATSAGSASSATNATNATYAVSLGNKDASDANSVNGNGWYSIARAKNIASGYGGHETLALNWYWGIDIRTGSLDWLKHNGNTVITSAGGTITGNLQVNGTFSIWGTAKFAGSSNVALVMANTRTSIVNYANSAYVPVYASAFTVNSSKLVKENIVDMSDDEAKKILSLRVVDFDYINGKKGQCGLIAEEVIDILPHCVYVSEDYSEEKALEQIENGELPDVPGIDYSKLVAPLIKLVQIQQKEIEELTHKVDKFINLMS